MQNFLISAKYCIFYTLQRLLAHPTSEVLGILLYKTTSISKIPDISQLKFSNKIFLLNVEAKKPILK